MEAGPAQVVAPHPAGFPSVVAAGSVVSLRLFVPGEPIPQARPRGRVQGRGEKAWVQFYEPKVNTEYKERVAETTRTQVLRTPVVEIGSGKDFLLPFVGVRALITLRFNMERPKSYPSRIVDHTKRPDFDNLGKAVVDAIVDAGILKDDGCITDATIQKRYADDEHPEGVEIDLTVMPTEV